MPMGQSLHIVQADISGDLDLWPLNDPSHPRVLCALSLSLGGAYLAIRGLREEEMALRPIAMPLAAEATAERE